jgi:hypothetical protein
MPTNTDKPQSSPSFIGASEGPEDIYGPSYPPGEFQRRWKIAQAILAAQRGELDGPRGGKAFRPLVDLSKNPSRECCLRNHFTGCAREYIGWLENMLKFNPNPERFIFAHLATIREQCFKSKRSEGKNYSRAQFNYSVALVHALGIVSPWHRLRGRWGAVLAPHEAVCKRNGSTCAFIGLHDCNYRMRLKDGWCTWLPQSGPVSEPDSL